MTVVDVFTAAKRSAVMASVRNADTGPERSVRSRLHRNGFRFRLHVRNLPGTPDIVLPRLRTVIFVHGCFWHGHIGCPKGKHRPTTNAAFWAVKIDTNRQRDRDAVRKLRRLGWNVITVWECHLRDEVHLDELIRKLKEIHV